VKALVTGATRGIGRSLVEHLVAGGWELAALGRREDAVRELGSALGERVTPYVADVTDGPRMAEVAAAAGDLDLVVANAGALLGAGTLWESDPEAWWAGVEVNLRGVYLTLRAVLPQMIERGTGRIVVLASGIGTEPSPYDTGYGASKAAVLQLASSVQVELEGTGVRVFPVSPGMVQTDMTRFPDELTRHVPEMADIPDDRFTPVDLLLGLVDEIASGRLDPLAGRFVHARDDRDRLLAEIGPADARARTLRLAPAWRGDPRG
jgi:3-oxoacyl-[acyl-carrier protein] reductase